MPRNQTGTMLYPTPTQLIADPLYNPLLDIARELTASISINQGTIEFERGFFVGRMSGAYPQAKITFGKTSASSELNLPTIYSAPVIAPAVGNDLVLESSSSSGGLVIKTGTGMTPRVVVTSQGRMGIGMLAPSAQLDVVGDIRATTTISTSGRITASGTISSSDAVISSGTGGYSFTGSSDTGMFSSSSGNVEIVANGNRMFWASSAFNACRASGELVLSPAAATPSALSGLTWYDSGDVERHRIFDDGTGHLAYRKNGGELAGYLFHGGNFRVTWTSQSAYDFSNIVGAWDGTKNYYDVFPPAGYTMSNLVGHIASLAVIDFAGTVSADDALMCTAEIMSDRVRVRGQNTEQASKPGISYFAIWSR